MLITGYRCVSRGEPIAWYEGGTLHAVTVADWKRGSDKDKLATAADWLATTELGDKIASTPGFVDSSEFKGMAKDLVDAVDIYVEASPDSDQTKVAEIAVMVVTVAGIKFP